MKAHPLWNVLSYQGYKSNYSIIKSKLARWLAPLPASTYNQVSKPTNSVTKPSFLLLLYRTRNFFINNGHSYR